MIVYKLVRKMKDGSLAPLFINKRMRYVIGEWHEAEDHQTKGYTHRPGFHCCLRPIAPHLKEREGRVWIQCIVEDYKRFRKPDSQGGIWILAQKLLPVGEV